MLINLENFTKEEHSSALKIFSHHPISLSFTEVILASSTPITQEHTKLLDCLSEPSSRLIHVSHIHPKRTYWLKLSLCVLSVSGFMILPVASLLSVKRASLSSQLPRNHLGSKLLSNTGRFSTSLLCRLHFSVLQRHPNSSAKAIPQVGGHQCLLITHPHAAIPECLPSSVLAAIPAILCSPT